VHRYSSIPQSPRVTAFVSLLFLVISATVFAQNIPAPQVAPAIPKFERFDVTDPETGVHSVRLLLTLPVTGNVAQTEGPRFTIECLDNKGKHDMIWSVSFGGVPNPGYVPKFRATQYNLYPPTYPEAKLRLIFEGYIKSKPFVQSWSELPSGELRYRNPGMGSPNMDSARWYLGFLNSLPGLRIGYAKKGPADPGELFFPTQALLTELNKTPACSQ